MNTETAIWGEYGLSLWRELIADPAKLGTDLGRAVRTSGGAGISGTLQVVDGVLSIALESGKNRRVDDRLAQLLELRFEASELRGDEMIELKPGEDADAAIERLSVSALPPSLQRYGAGAAKHQAFLFQFREGDQRDDAAYAMGLLPDPDGRFEARFKARRQAMSGAVSADAVDPREARIMHLSRIGAGISGGAPRQVLVKSPSAPPILDNGRTLSAAEQARVDRLQAIGGAISGRPTLAPATADSLVASMLPPAVAAVEAQVAALTPDQQARAAKLSTIGAAVSAKQQSTSGENT